MTYIKPGPNDRNISTQHIATKKAKFAIRDGHQYYTFEVLFDTDPTNTYAMSLYKLL